MACVIAIALMAYSRIGPESLVNYRGTGGLKLVDVPELEIDGRRKVQDCASDDRRWTRSV